MICNHGAEPRDCGVCYAAELMAKTRALQVMHWIIIGKAVGAWADIVYEGPGAVF